MQKIHSYFKVGNIKNDTKNNAIVYYVNSFQDLTNVIIPHFEKYPLITKKYADFLLFKQVIDFINKGEHLTIEGLNKIISIKASMNNGLSSKLKESFPGIIPVVRPLVEKQILDPHWIAGFANGEGSFFIRVQKKKTKTGFSVSICFSCCQHLRNAQLINSFVNYLDCGGSYNARNIQLFSVSKISDINNKIIPFFIKYPIIGIKRLDFEDFCKVAVLIQDKAHLTIEGLEKIRKIKGGMNEARKYDN